MDRDLKNMSQDTAAANGWDILKDLQCEVIGKATFDNGSTKIMKSTKRFKVSNGWIYNTSTEIHENGRVAVAEALVFVHE